MKSVLISIQPKWCELIASGKKTVEVRKTKPKLETPFKVYIYCTKDKNFNFCTDDGEQYTHIGNGKVIGEFVCDSIRCEKEVADGLVDIVLERTSCVSARELVEYANGNVLYPWHISNLVIYDKPRELRGFFHERTFHAFTTEWNIEGIVHYPIKKTIMDEIRTPPQSWCYVEDLTAY